MSPRVLLVFVSVLLASCGTTRVRIDEESRNRIAFVVTEEHGFPRPGICGMSQPVRQYKAIVDKEKLATYNGRVVEYRFFEQLGGDYITAAVAGVINVDWSGKTVTFDLTPNDSTRGLKGSYTFSSLISWGP